MSNKILTPEERFAKIVNDLAIEIETVEKENAELKRKLAICNYPIEHGGNCGNCDEYKHLPWRDDEFGYICATCLHDITKHRLVTSHDKFLKEILSILESDESKKIAIDKLIEEIGEFDLEDLDI